MIGISVPSDEATSLDRFYPQLPVEDTELAKIPIGDEWKAASAPATDGHDGSKPLSES